ncbi:hypothetical protein HUU42_04290 [bacterium]|nr:hypothetical protein [bacterium]
MKKNNLILLFCFFLIVCLLTAGGRVASSDENGFFLEVQSLVEQQTLAIPEGIINNGVYGKDGRYYLGGGIGFSLVALPFYIIGKLAIAILPIPDAYHIFILKGAFSLTNQFLTALLAVMFFMYARSFNYSTRLAFFLTAALIFSTNIFPYAKSAMREPLLTLSLLGIFFFLRQFELNRKISFLHAAGFCFALLIHTKLVFIVLLPVIAIYFSHTVNGPYLPWRSNWPKNLLSIMWNQTNSKFYFAMYLWLLVAFGGMALYNFVQFGNIFSSGYTEKGQPFTNPLWVGVYGLLFSSGKSFFLYAPVTVLTFVSFRNFAKEHRIEACVFVSIFLIMLIVHAKFFSWAGDGSWGPRYLIPLLPFCVVIAGKRLQNSLEQRRNFSKLAAIALFLLGIGIQTGGTSVYLGSYLRWIGEYPFTTNFSDPEFLYKSHFIPNYSPVTGHWKLLFVSLQKHADGEIGPLSVTSDRQRIPLSENDQAKLPYLIDYWFMYAYYGGARPLWIIVAAAAGLVLTAFLGWRTCRKFCNPY